MLEISGKTNLLEQNAYKYSLQDVAEPNLQRDIYTQGMVPKVPFNHRRVPMNMPEEIWITDTSLRDGQQSVEPYTVEQIVNIYKYLSRLGGPYGIIRQTEFFIYSKKDREALEKCMELGLKFPEITTWIRATKEDFRLVRDLGIRETGILVSCSDYHIFKKMKMTRRQAMDYYLATVADAFEAGVVPRCHLEDITRADFYGFVVPFVNELQKLSRQAGIPVKLERKQLGENLQDHLQIRLIYETRQPITTNDQLRTLLDEYRNLTEDGVTLQLDTTLPDDLTLRLLLAWTRVPDGRKTRRGSIEAAGRMKAARPPSGAAFVIP